MEFDYVIVGGGSAGSVLAARLSETPGVTVCLIEAGGEGRDLAIRMPLGIVAMVSGKPKYNNWALFTEPQEKLNGRCGFQPRGKALGGSSAINAMLYVRGHPSDYDRWASLGCAGWSWPEVLPWFIRTEGNQRGDSRLHGGSGPLQVGEQQTPRQVSARFIEACRQAGLPLNDDFNGPEQEGAGLYQVTQFWDGPRKGERCSAAAAYLHPVMGRGNLEVITGAHAERLTLDGRTVRGVAIRRGGKRLEVKARREVILCSGAFGSPHLLLLSGIGPAAKLKGAGVEVVHDLPGVGENLQDHLDYVHATRSIGADTVGLAPPALMTIGREMLRWRKDGTGLCASPVAEVGAFFRSSPEAAVPDLQLHFVIGLLEDHARKLHLPQGYSGHVCVLRPFSRGEVGLYGPDPSLPPRINPRFLSDGRDEALLISGIRRMLDIMGRPALDDIRGRDLHPFAELSDTEILKHIRARADTIYHPVGTCRMGIDALSVVDPEAMKVRGMERLRVIDASVMPTLIGGNTNAPTIMMAERMAARIAAGR
jgi:choline dehydrogenase-like flavoprotein